MFSLESFLIAVNLKLDSQCEQERLREVVKSLSSIIIAFDFDLNGQYRSYVDHRFTYEQLLYLCCVKINQLKVPTFENHMFKTPNSAFRPFSINLKQDEIVRRLISSDCLAVLYFMDKNDDGSLWRQLYGLIGSSIMKYLFIYAYMFKPLENNPHVYIQICGPKFNFAYKGLMARKLEADEKAILTKWTLKKEKFNEPELV